MRCPFCAHEDSQVKDSRPTEDNASIRRRRQCTSCGARFTTFERVQLREVAIVKSGDRRENFDRSKLENSVALACRKRPVSSEQMDEAAQRVLILLEQRRETPVPSSAVGEAVMEVLRDVDAVAYVRFASVYQAFESVEEFVDVIRPLTEQE